MNITTKFSNGDTVYEVLSYQTECEIRGPYTVGQVRVQITDSPGIEGEERFDNYKAQKQREEEYMFIETGIGSGTIHKLEDLFATKAEATKEYNNRLKNLQEKE